MRFLSALVCVLVAIGCSGEVKFPPPATSESLRESVYTFYRSVTEPGPSGVLVATRRGDETRHLILTAGHVVKLLFPLQNDQGESHLGFRSADRPHVVRRISAPTNHVRPFLHTAYPGEDLGGFLVKGLEKGVKSNNGHVCAIDLDRPLGNGVGVVRDEADYARYSISVGTEVFAYCSDILKPIGNLGYDWCDSVIVRTGTIRDLHAKLETPQDPTKRQNAIIVDFPSVNGNSGGPVFVYGLVNGIRYPFLLGVVSGQVGVRTDWAAVAPIWPVVKEIADNLK